jgi:hypothetical protein
LGANGAMEVSFLLPHLIHTVVVAQACKLFLDHYIKMAIISLWLQESVNGVWLSVLPISKTECGYSLIMRASYGGYCAGESPSLFQEH